MRPGVVSLIFLDIGYFTKDLSPNVTSFTQRSAAVFLSQFLVFKSVVESFLVESFGGSGGFVHPLKGTVLQNISPLKSGRIGSIDL